MTTQEQVSNDPRYKVLHEHGFVGLIGTMGSDSEIADAARVSYGTGTRSVSDDRNLIRYLVRHKHTSPLEMAEVKFHIKLPIFIMRQLVRHRTANLNEYSARYSELSNDFYLPDYEYIAPQSTVNKQGRAGDYPSNVVEHIQEEIFYAYDAAYTGYTQLLANKAHCDLEYPGLSRELARIVMPVGNYTECYWKCDLHNFFHLCKLRMDKHAQREIIDYATTMYELAKPHFPNAAEAFEDYIFHSKTLSRLDIELLSDLKHGFAPESAQDYGMSKREYEEFLEFWRNL